MAKVVNLFGIREKAILSRTKNLGNYIYVIMKPITKEDEKTLDNEEELNINGNIVTKDDVYCYGEFDVTNPEDINYVKKFNIINLDNNNQVHSNFDFESGEVIIEGNIAKMYDCYDVIKWFKYNYLLIGKPNRIIIYKCKQENL